jgi:putative transposase
VQKKHWGRLNGRWVGAALRDEVVGFVDTWSGRAGLPAKRLLRWMGLTAGKYHAWKARRSLPNRHNGAQSRRFWLLEWERKAIIAFAIAHPLEGYRRLTYMMLDADVVAASPSSVYRVLKAEELLGRGAAAPSAKGTGFVPPTKPHAHWHIDVSYINIAGTFYYLCAVLDGYSRFIVHWEIRAQMQEQDIEIILQRARERVPAARPRIISDNGPQFIAKDFKVFIRLMGMTHVRTSPFYPQSNGKLERWHQSLKRECIRPNSPVLPGRRPPPGGNLCARVQRGAPAQRHRLHCPARPAARACPEDSRQPPGKARSGRRPTRHRPTRTPRCAGRVSAICPSSMGEEDHPSW